MTVSFSNHCHSYDATRRIVRFWGHDRSVGSAFFLTTDARHELHPKVQFEKDDVLRIR